ncbi:VirD4-like conjugal transfer protein, CD1115 family [Enterococcus faecalis]|uniref:VirD4-like conjugal transfer protein, CD1115 family n=1 Tax=Enterococcus faecalis TaxID=1351 RepID=UPI001A978387|nr:type IV secretory system conjugative DNA transfer family protein [Enterococcus faecalis]MBO1138040.1 type IV secretory system conjugative DNA transfer family protein [Enterococcus faecalis]
MQIYKKNIKNYLILSSLLFILCYGIGNFFWFLPGSNYEAKWFFLFSDELGSYVSTMWPAFFLTPSFSGFFAGVFGFLLGMLGYVYDNDRGVYRTGEEHGSARFATVEEIKKFADENPANDMIFTKHARMGLFNRRLPFNYQKNKNILVLGGPGSGKTHTFIKPNLMQRNASFIVTDPKGLLVHETGAMLKEAGYKIKVFDLVNLSNSNSFNVFNYIKTELDVDRVLEFITEGTKKSEQQGEDFWIQAESLLIRSLIAYLWFDGKDNEYTPNLSMVADMLRHIERKDPKIPSPVEKWFEEQNQVRPNNYAYKQWTLYNDSYKAETRASVLAIASARYSVFDHEQVIDMVREDTMNIEKWNEEKTAVFIAIPETSSAYNFLAAIFLATAMETLKNKADRVFQGLEELKEGRQLLHVRFLIDEFYNIGRIPNIDKALGSFRSREMSIVMVLQAMNQLEAMYKNTWKTLVNTCDNLLFLGGDEEDTTRYLSKRAGKQTISLRKHTINHGKNGSGSENRDRTGRDLLMPDEIGRLGNGKALLFISGQHVFKDDKFTVQDHENAHLLADNYQDSNWYTYKHYRNEEEEILDKVRPENIIDHGMVGEDAA